MHHSLQEFELPDGIQNDTILEKIEPLTARIDVRKTSALPREPRDEFAEKYEEELLRAIWSILVSLVDLGFGVHPAQAVSTLPPGEAEGNVGASHALAAE